MEFVLIGPIFRLTREFEYLKSVVQFVKLSFSIDWKLCVSNRVGTIEFHQIPLMRFILQICSIIVY